MTQSVGVLPGNVGPGDVLVVRTMTRAGWMVRLGATIGDKPNTWDHVLVYIKYEDGVHWGIQGAPGGVGWVDVGHYLADKKTISNAEQPKTDAQRAGICAVMTAMVVDHVQYDWPAIAVAVLTVVRPLWQMGGEWGPGIPGHVICSSAADLACERVGLASPKPDRYCFPYHWAEFDLRKAWETS